MVEKVSVNPDRIRCLGNIVSPKTLSDYYNYCSKVTSGSDTVSGDTKTVYTSNYLWGSNLTLSCDRLISPGSASFTVTATLKESSFNTGISNGSLKCIVNDGVVLTGSTNTSGNYTFTIPIVEESKYTIKVSYAGTPTTAGCFAGITAYVGTVTGVTVTCEEALMKTGDTNQVIATVTGTFGDETDKGVPYQSVSFYEYYEPTSITVTGSVNPVISGEDTVITAVLRDSDGSMIKGETVNIYEEYEPTSLTVNATINPLITGETSVISAVLRDSDGSGIKGETVNIYVEE